jgi:hypothetical protein
MRADIHDGQEHKRSVQGPDTEAQDLSPPNHHFPLATRGRSIQKCQEGTYAVQQRTQLFDHLVGEQQQCFRDGEPKRLASGVKLDIGNPVALAPAQAGLFILALEGCQR